MGSIGTPIIAVESRTIEHLGWNQYGGWRVNIQIVRGKINKTISVVLRQKIRKVTNWDGSN